MKKIEHIGTVVTVDGDKAVVELESAEQCSVGFRCFCCPSLRLEAHTIRVERSDLQQGDTVCVSIPAYSGYLSVLLVFVLPLAMFVTGVIVGAQLEGGTAAHGMGTLAGGALGFVLGILAAVAANRRLARASKFDVRRLEQGKP